MLQLRYATLTVVLAVLLLAGCAGSKEAAKAPHPLAGAWDWSIDTPQGVFTGILTFAEAEDMLSGTIALSEAPEQAVLLEEIMFDGEMSKVTFKYSNPEYGLMLVDLKLADDDLNGMMNVTQFGAEVPMTAARKAME